MPVVVECPPNTPFHRRESAAINSRSDPPDCLTCLHINSFDTSKAIQRKSRAYSSQIDEVRWKNVATRIQQVRVRA
jgi:hypothetical protein